MELPKVEIKKILYPTDLSENARHAFAYAVALAQLNGAELVILHVLDEHGDLESRVAGYIDMQQWAAIKEEMAADAWTTLSGKRKTVANAAVGKALMQFHKNTVREMAYPENGPVEIAMEKGDAAEVIIAQVREHGCDLIVMGTYGQRSLIEVMAGVGRTAARVVRQSPVPVLAVPLPRRK